MRCTSKRQWLRNLNVLVKLGQWMAISSAVLRDSHVQLLAPLCHHQEQFCSSCCRYKSRTSPFEIICVDVEVHCAYNYEASNVALPAYFRRLRRAFVMPKHPASMHWPLCRTAVLPAQRCRLHLCRAANGGDNAALFRPCALISQVALNNCGNNYENLSTQACGELNVVMACETRRCQATQACCALFSGTGRCSGNRVLMR